MPQKTIIIAIISLLVISFISLAYIENLAKDPDINKDWWVLSFQEPHGNNLDFTIENHSNSDNFTYTVSQNNTPINRESISIPKGETRNITVNQVLDTDTKTTITAWTGVKDKKEIYK
jgi:hypothetical protein